MSEKSESALFQAVVNQEAQYSIWPVDRVLPAGWKAEGKTGPKEECLEHIAKVWTDMRPIGARKA